ncbi:multiheme c-type cytochrome [Pedobacter sp. AW31-3R]|uniref:multiheme c-type cytochrome n=1 Tax=Pedobacter sp. AW31-3R TaxID=3445781 RepID=UPI003FA03EA3
MGLRRFLIVFIILAAFVIVIVQCTKVEKKDSRGPAYAGSSTCVKCHRNIEDSYLHNAHFNASRILSQPNSIDSLSVPDGEFLFNENTKVGVERRDSGLYQIALVNGRDMKAEHTDVVFGAGKSAYTFAFWYGNKLMQMPLNYLTKERQWVNSPGFPTDQIYFGRPIIARCLECHSSYVDKKLVQTDNFNMEEEFVKGSLIAGIDCERCHGPAAKHVAFHEANPKEKKAVYMVNYRSLALSRRVDMCGVCHSGTALQTLTSTFSFKPGDTLKTLPQYNAYTGEDADVHGKQKQLLEASACYKIGKAECITCHDAHSGVKLSMEIYAQKCISCHQEVKHEQLSAKDKALLTKNCIDCHMPVKESQAIGFQKSNSKEKIPYKLRTHRIAVYNELISKKLN